MKPPNPSPAVTALIEWALIIFALVFVLRLLSGLLRLRGKKNSYRAQDTLLSPAERSFFGVLKSVAAAHCEIGFKVRLADIITPKKAGSGRQAAFNQISSKHVDFLLCRIDDMTPLLAIELDDSSHARKDRAQRDAFVDAALRSAGIPILRVVAKRAYNPNELRENILALIGGDKVTASLS